MQENEFNIVCSVAGAKIKSKITGFIETNHSEMSQGQDDFIITIRLEFDPEDIPGLVEVECTPPAGFESMEKVSLKPGEGEITAALEMKITYENAPVGYYTIEGKIQHSDYGTELAELEASFFNLRVPELKIRNCTIEPNVVSRSDKFEVKAELYSSAPQKVKGVLSGKLKPAEGSSTIRVYELEPKKIGVKGERLVNWSQMVPRDELDIGDYYIELKFDSKDTMVDAAFQDIMRLKRPRDILVRSILPDLPVASKTDTVKIQVGLTNIGIEIAKAVLIPEITSPDGKLITLPARDIEITPDSDHDSEWSWEVPEGAGHGHYQLSLKWAFTETGETDTIPGETVEIRPKHSVEIKSISTDKNFYLSGHEVRIMLYLTDSGTRGGKNPLEVAYRIKKNKGGLLHEDRTEVLVPEGGKELKLIWQIPSSMKRGSLGFIVEIASEGNTLLSRKYAELINVEQPIALKFDMIQPVLSKQGKDMNKYVLEGESVTVEDNYHGLKFIKLSSNTSLLKYDNKIVGGLGWTKAGKYKIKAVENLYFSHIMLSRGLSYDNLREIASEWDELGRIWSAKLVNAAAAISTRKSIGGLFSLKAKNAFDRQDVVLKSNLIGELKRIKLDDRTLRSWNTKIIPIIKLVKIIGDKKLREMIAISHSEKYGKSILDLTLTFMAKNEVRDKGKMASSMNEFIEILNKRVFPDDGGYGESLTAPLSRWYHKLKDVKIEIEVDDENAQLLDLIYCMVILKSINRVITIINNVERTNKIPKAQFIDLCFYMVDYHMLCLERLVNRIRYDRFLDENITQKELAVHYEAIEEVGGRLELILTSVMRLVGNQRNNMDLRLKAAMLYDSIELVGDTGLLNGLSGEQVRQKIEFKNNTNESVEFNLLFAFPSSEWHLLEPESNLIEGVYWRENISAPPRGKYSENIVVIFPKSLSLQEYKGLIKLEPVGLKLLDE